MLCFVSLLHSHLIKWIKTENDLETVSLENDLWIVKWGSYSQSQLCLFHVFLMRKSGGSQNSLYASVFPLAVLGESTSANLQWGCSYKQLMLRKLPMCVKCYRCLCVFVGLQNTLKTYPSTKSRQHETQRPSAERKQTANIYDRNWVAACE